MCIDGHISSSASQALMLPVWNVFFGLGVDVFFGQAKVNDVDDVFLLVPLPSDEKVLRFDISIDEVFRVHVLHSRNLVRKKTESAKRTMNTDLIKSHTRRQSQQKWETSSQKDCQTVKSDSWLLRYVSPLISIVIQYFLSDWFQQYYTLKEHSTDFTQQDQFSSHGLYHSSSVDSSTSLWKLLNNIWVKSSWRKQTHNGNLLLQTRDVWFDRRWPILVRKGMMNDVVELYYKKCRIQCFLTLGTESQDILVSVTVSPTH